MNFDGTIWGKYGTKPWKFLEKMGRSSIKSTWHRGWWGKSSAGVLDLYIEHLLENMTQPLGRSGDQGSHGSSKKNGMMTPRLANRIFRDVHKQCNSHYQYRTLLKKIGRSPTVIRVFETMSWEPDHQRRQRASGYEKVGREESFRCSRRTFKPRHSKGADYGPTAGWSENCQRAIPKNFFPEVPKCNSQNLLETWCWWTRLSFSIFFPHPI